MQELRHCPLGQLQLVQQTGLSLCREGSDTMMTCVSRIIACIAQNTDCRRNKFESRDLIARLIRINGHRETAVVA